MICTHAIMVPARMPRSPALLPAGLKSWQGGPVMTIHCVPSRAPALSKSLVLMAVTSAGKVSNACSTAHGGSKSGNRSCSRLMRWHATATAGAEVSL